MAKHLLVVFTNPAEGREKEYNDWYSDRHLADVLKVPGFVSAQRFALSDAQRAAPPHPWRYMALYEIETDDLGATLKALGEASGSEAMPLSDAMGIERMSYAFRPITDKVRAKPD